MGKRRLARENALKVLYQIEVTGDDPDQTLSDMFWLKKGCPADVVEFTRELVRGTLSHLEQIDALIRRCSDHWSLSRIGAVERNILRFAIYELRYCSDVPYSIAINEAIEIARKFGDAEAPPFINGVLDRVKEEAPNLMATSSKGEH